MGRSEEVGARRQATKVESDREIRVKSLHIRDCTTGCFFRVTTAVGGNGDHVIATRV